MATMPSASLVSNSASTSTTTSKEPMDTNQTVAETPLGQAVQMLEKKVRNLEKRKSKLDGYRADYNRGKELNDDQKSAIAKYEEVIQTLEFARELSGQFKTLIQDEDKVRKKLLKKEQLEKAKSEVQKLAQVIEIQDLLALLSKAKIRSDFTNGNHGAVKLTKEQLASIDEFSKSVAFAGRKLSDAEYDKLTASTSDNFINLLEGKANKKIGKTNFKDLKSIFDSIKACGYFQTKVEEDEEKSGGRHGKGKKDAHAHNGDAKKEETPAAPIKTETASAPKEIVEIIPEPAVPAPSTSPQPVPVVAAEPAPQQQQQQFVEIPQQQQQVPQQHREAFIHPQSQIPHHHEIPAAHPQQPPQQIDFFQDSQIDMESPHMDPAVVMVHSSPPQHLMSMMNNMNQQQSNSSIPSQTFTNQMYIPPTTHDMQQHQQQQQHMMYSNAQPQQSQQQQPIQQQEHQQQHFDYPPEDQTLVKRIGQVSLSYPDDDVAEKQDQGFAGDRTQADAMANIEEWDNEQAAAAAGNGNEEFNRSGSWRGSRGRGRGSGNGGGYRGERRGGYRGERDGERDNGYRGGDRDNGGYRGERDNGYRGGDNGYRGDRGTYRGRGADRGGDRPRGGPRNDRGNMPPRDREYRGGRGGTGAPAPRGRGGYAPRPANGYSEQTAQ